MEARHQTFEPLYQRHPFYPRLRFLDPASLSPPAIHPGVFPLPAPSHTHRRLPLHVSAEASSHPCTRCLPAFVSCPPLFRRSLAGSVVRLAACLYRRDRVK